MVVKGFKDITGQEFLAEVIDSGPRDKPSYTIKNPLCLVPTEKGMVPVPYVTLTQDELVIDGSKLLFKPFDPVENVANHYKQMFGGIVTADSRLIV